MACMTSRKSDTINSATPRYNPLSGRFRKSFAFYTLSERYPLILTELIESLNRDKNEIAQSHGGEDTLIEIEYLVESITKLRHDLQFDEQFEAFSGEEPDKALWNDFIEELDPDFCSFFHSNWSHAECYLYRKVSSFFESTNTLKNYDYFAKQKRSSITKNGIISVAGAFLKTEKDFNIFDKLIKQNLWANKCDLSTVLAKEFEPNDNLFEQLDSYNDKLLVNNSKDIWQCLESADHSKPVIVELIIGNAGYELFADLILAAYLIDKQLATKVRFSVKAIPCFVSDVITSDVHWLLQFLSKLENPVIKRFTAKFKQHFKDHKFVISPVHYYWVSPYEYFKMHEIAPDLYQYLNQARLVIFKGDLNYRKLLGDMNWDPSDEFITCIRGFRPTNFCVLRAVKSDLICGLPHGKAEQLHHLDRSWMCTADYGVIQFLEGRVCDCHLVKNI